MDFKCTKIVAQALEPSSLVINPQHVQLYQPCTVEYSRIR